jgi:hypothetical protein
MMGFWLAMAILLTLPSPTIAQNKRCETTAEVDKYQLLRRFSLDLRGQLPDYQDYIQLEGLTGPTLDAHLDSMLDAYLSSEGFRQRMREYHEAKLWPNIRDTNFRFQLATLTQARTPGPRRFIGQDFRINRGYRGGDGRIYEQSCGEWEQVSFTPEGVPTGLKEVTPQTCLNRGLTAQECSYKQEGWVWVQPYWSDEPAERIRVCAFDAQDLDISNKLSGHTCSSRRTISQLAFADPAKTITPTDCGCGYRLQNCFVQDYGRFEPQLNLQDAFREQLLRLVDDTTLGGAPYTDLLLTKRVHENGIIQHYRKHLSQRDGIFPAVQALDGEAPFQPNITWNAPWQTFTRQESGYHAGLLTLPAFLLRFASNRSRANRARIAFTNQFFVPGGMADGDLVTDDLTQRQDCRSCHETLEPLAAYFAPMIENSFSQRTEQLLPLFQKACALGPKPGCEKYIVEGEFAGVLKTHRVAVTKRQNPMQDEALFELKEVGDTDVHDRIIQNIARGPQGFAEEIIADGSFSEGTVYGLFVHLLKRTPILDDSLQSETEIFEQLVSLFQNGDSTSAAFDFAALVKRIVRLPQYRRAL